MRIWSQAQQAIFTWFRLAWEGFAEEISESGKRYLIVRARAGTGKTTTIIEGINQAPEKRILLCAFNKNIADELASRITNPCGEAKTSHSVGFASVRQHWPGVKVDNQWRAINLTDKIAGPDCPVQIKKLITKLNVKGREMKPHATTGAELVDLAYAFECDPSPEWQADGWTVERVCDLAVRCMDLAARQMPYKGIDYADMIFLPVRNGWLRPLYDLVVIDEGQDWTNTQLELATGVCSKTGRIAIVGDDRQAIYGFRGADSQSLDRLKKELAAHELPLTTTYRCCKAVVAVAQGFVPDFRAGDDNPEGSVSDLTADKLTSTAEYGDFILSRKNAPLVSVAMKLLREGKRARVKGRDIGEGLKNLLAKLIKNQNSIPMLLTRIDVWREKECARMEAAKRPEKVEAIMDQADMLIFLCDGAKGVSEVGARIDSLFSDDGRGDAGVITCSSVHKAKGLEANRVFLLADTFRANTEEEINIQYVAVTRAKQSLVWVHPSGSLLTPTT